MGCIHPYPARFIPEIPRRLIEAYRPTKDLALLDPFCGSGTSLVEAQAAGIPSVGVDLNPIAVMIARAKTSLLPELVDRAAGQVVEAASADRAPPLPALPRLDHWFRPEVQVALASLATAVSTQAEDVRNVLRLALSSIIVRVSNQESDTRYAAVEKPVSREEVFRHFIRAIRRILDALRSRPAPLPEAEVIEADVLTLTASQSTISAVRWGRCSPPCQRWW